MLDPVSVLVSQTADPNARREALAHLHDMVEETFFMIADRRAEIESSTSNLPEAGSVLALLARAAHLAGLREEAADYALRAGDNVAFCENTPFSQSVTNTVIRNYIVARRAGAEPAAGAAAVFATACSPASPSITSAVFCADAREWGLLREHMLALDDAHLGALLSVLATVLHSDPTHAEPATRDLADTVARVFDSRSADPFPRIMRAEFRAAAGGSLLADLTELLGSGSADDLGVACQLAADSAATLLPADAAAVAADVGGDLREIFPDDARVEQLIHFISGGAARDAYEAYSSYAPALDVSLLNAIRAAVAPAKALAVTSAGTALAAALASGRTGSADFWDANLNWFGKQSEWSQFRVVAGQGAMLAGTEVELAMQQLASFLPFGGSPGRWSTVPPQRPYAAAGALYALGIAAAAAPPAATLDSYVEHIVEQSLDPIMLVGALMLAGLAYIGRGATTPAAVLQWALAQLTATSALEVAHASFAAAICVGLIFFGAAANDADLSVLKNLLNPSDNMDRHPLGRLGTSLGTALVCYGAGSKANDIINDLLQCRHEEKRVGAAYAIGLAHIASADLHQIHRLLGIAVGDVAAPARAAATAVGLVCADKPDLAIRTLAQLTRSYEPAVRAGCAMGLALAAAGSHAAAPAPGTMQKECDRIRRVAMPTEDSETAQTTECEYALDLTRFTSATEADVGVAAAAAAGQVPWALPLIEPLLLDGAPAVAYASAMAAGLLLQATSGTEDLPHLTMTRVLHARAEKAAAEAELAKVKGGTVKQKSIPTTGLCLRDFLMHVVASRRMPGPSRAGASAGLGLLYNGGMACEFALTTNGRVSPLAAIAGVFLSLSHEWFSLGLLFPAACRPAAPLLVLPDGSVPLNHAHVRCSRPIAPRYLETPTIWSEESKTRKSNKVTVVRATLTGEAKKTEETQKTEERPPLVLVENHTVMPCSRLPTAVQLAAEGVVEGEVVQAVPGRAGGLIVVTPKF